MAERDIHEEETIELQMTPADREALERLAQEAAKLPPPSTIPGAYAAASEPA